MRNGAGIHSAQARRRGKGSGPTISLNGHGAAKWNEAGLAITRLTKPSSAAGTGSARPVGLFTVLFSNPPACLVPREQQLQMIFSMGRWSSERIEFGVGPHMIGHARAGQPTFPIFSRRQPSLSRSKTWGESEPIRRRAARPMLLARRDTFFFADGAVLEHVGEDFQKTG